LANLWFDFRIDRVVLNFLIDQNCQVIALDDFSIDQVYEYLRV